MKKIKGQGTRANDLTKNLAAISGAVTILLSKILGASLMMLFLSLPAAADEPLQQLMNLLQQRYENLETMKAHFTQSYQSKRFSDRLSESGIVYFKKGGLMKWEYQKPERKIFVSDGRYYFYYVPADKQVIKAVAESDQQHAPTLFLAGRGHFLKDFRAEWADPRPGSHLVKLTPVNKQPDFQYMIVDIDPTRGFVLRLTVIDPYDNRTEYKFDQIQENPELSPTFFAFKPPPGTDVIFQRDRSSE